VNVPPDLPLLQPVPAAPILEPSRPPTTGKPHDNGKAAATGLPIRILELRSVRGTGGGPDKTLFSTAARSDPSRFAVTVCYIRDRRDDVYALDRVAASSLGVDYVEIFERHSFDPAIWPALRRLVRDRHVDIIHSHDYKTNFLAFLLARAEKLPFVATAHGWTGHTIRERRFYYPADRWVLRRFPRVITVSDEIRGQLVHRRGRNDRISTILNGIDPNVFQRRNERVAAARESFGIPSSAIVVGSVGRLEPQKRFDLLLEAVLILRRKEQRIRVLVAGDGSLRQELTNRAVRMGLANSCTFTGHRTDAAGGTGQLIADGVEGLLVNPGDSYALTSAVAKIFDNPEAAKQRVRAARRRVEQEFALDQRMQKLASIYSELASAHRRDC
jgi:glycosyltransferase involved in cell wall biosynthesis